MTDVTRPTYDEAHRYADTLFPRDLWDLGQSDLEKITETLRSLASTFDAVLRLNPSLKHPHPGRSLIKRVGNVDVRVELAVTGPNRSLPDRPEDFEYVLSVFRTPRRGLFQRLFLRHDPTEWRVIGTYPPAEVREASVRLRQAIERAARTEFSRGAS